MRCHLIKTTHLGWAFTLHSIQVLAYRSTKDHQPLNWNAFKKVSGTDNTYWGSALTAFNAWKLKLPLRFGSSLSAVQGSTNPRFCTQPHSTEKGAISFGKALKDIILQTLPRCAMPGTTIYKRAFKGMSLSFFCSWTVITMCTHLLPHPERSFAPWSLFLALALIPIQHDLPNIIHVQPSLFSARLHDFKGEI